MGRMIDMTEVEAEYLKYRFKQYLGSVSRAIQNKRLKEQKMGMMIKEKCYLYGSCKCQTAGCVVPPDDGCPVYRYFKELIVKDYKNHLKADMVVMLEELDLQIDESAAYNLEVAKVQRLIRDKIDKLKGENE